MRHSSLLLLCLFCLSLWTQGSLALQDSPLSQTHDDADIDDVSHHSLSASSSSPAALSPAPSTSGAGSKASKLTADAALSILERANDLGEKDEYALKALLSEDATDLDSADLTKMEKQLFEVEPPTRPGKQQKRAKLAKRKRSTRKTLKKQKKKKATRNQRRRKNMKRRSRARQLRRRKARRARRRQQQKKRKAAQRRRARRNRRRSSSSSSASLRDHSSLRGQLATKRKQRKLRLHRLEREEESHTALNVSEGDGGDAPAHHNVSAESIIDYKIIADADVLAQERRRHSLHSNVIGANATTDTGADAAIAEPRDPKMRRQYLAYGFSPCSKSCGPGVQFHRYICADLWGYARNHSECAYLPNPPGWERIHQCNNGPCPDPKWVPIAQAPCRVKCGVYGTQNVTFHCMWPNNTFVKPPHKCHGHRPQRYIQKCALEFEKKPCICPQEVMLDCDMKKAGVIRCEEPHGNECICVTAYMDRLYNADPDAPRARSCMHNFRRKPFKKECVCAGNAPPTIAKKKKRKQKKSKAEEKL